MGQRVVVLRWNYKWGKHFANIAHVSLAEICEPLEQKFCLAATVRSRSKTTSEKLRVLKVSILSNIQFKTKIPASPSLDFSSRKSYMYFVSYFPPVQVG